MRRSARNKSRREFLKWGAASGVGMTMLTGGAATTPKTASAAGHTRDILFERMEKIYTDGRWNGRPEIVLWKDHYYLFCHTGTEHASTEGRVRAFRSKPKSPTGWEPLREFDTNQNDAEVHVLATEERLFVYIVRETFPDVGGMPIDTLVSYTDDGENWSELKPIYQKEFSFWKPITHQGVHYVAADVMVGERRVELLKSQDGLSWEKVSNIEVGRRTETALGVLKDGTMCVVIRQRRIAVAKPPYKEWTLTDAPSVGGPAIGVVGDTVLVSGRVGSDTFPDDQPGPARTAMFVLHTDPLNLEWKMNLPTQWGGDVSYPHFLPIDDSRTLFAWYDGEPYEKGIAKQADLFLATIRLV